ncbi:MAG: polysaccharide deacetylase family protein, partial [Gemmatimonadales bacterium]|nr:polysaccharide deacetylase family protein [Gemmatimonadales bacterium]NIN49341.1 polysaccharide deacetylase family protein [Gemmatimonadales bacterium]NIP06805.1 polysaccharide deacetylase family protein [Gemmatimonadales bacterium]NIS65225.1 polysaccharide deacetylase family protein [Gemmatimonadales bacterium]
MSVKLRQEAAHLSAHHFTVDVEEYFQVSAFEARVQRTRWELLESRVAANVAQLVRLLNEHRAKATFFILGWVAERHPELVRMVVEAGHEVASHGWGHRRVTEQTPEEFRDSVRRTKQLLEDLIRGSRHRVSGAKLFDRSGLRVGVGYTARGGL